MVDTPDGWSASLSTGVVLSDADRTATATDVGSSVFSTAANTSGKHYVEVSIAVAAPFFMFVGAADFSEALSWVSDGSVNSGEYTVAPYAAGDTICVALDCDADLAWIRTNGGNWNDNPSANPATGVGGMNFVTTSAVIGVLFATAGSVSTLFAGPSFAYAMPAGFVEWYVDAAAEREGAAAVVEAADTVAAAGVLAIKGAAGLTEAADAVSGAAQVAAPGSGSATITEAADTAAAAGLLPIKGAAAIAEAADSVAATVVASSRVAASAITEAADTASAAAKVFTLAPPVDYGFTEAAFQGGGTTNTLSVTADIGDADTDRVVVAYVVIEKTGSPASYAFTIGGVAATIDRTMQAGAQYIIRAIVPTGTTAAIECVASGGTSPVITSIRALVYWIQGPVTKVDATNTVAFASSASVPITQVATGLTIAAAQSYAALSWTYPTEDEQVDNGSGIRFGVASAATITPSSGTVAVSGGTAVFLGAVHYAGVVTIEATLDLGVDSIAAFLTNAAQEATLSVAVDEIVTALAADAGVDASMSVSVDEIVTALIAEAEIPADFFTRVLLSRESGEAIIILVTITHPSLETPVRVCLNTPGFDIVSNGYTFTATFFDVVLVSDNDQSPTARLRIANVNRQVGALIDEINDAPTVRIDVVLASNPDRLERSFKQMKLRRATWDASMVEGELALADFQNTPWPGTSTTPALFPALFK